MDEIMTLKLDSLEAQLKPYQAIGLGPGFSVRDQTKFFLERAVLEFSGPSVLDADALNTLSEFNLKTFLSKRGKDCILLYILEKWQDY